MAAEFNQYMLAYMIAYALCTVAFIMLLRMWLGKGHRVEYRRAIYTILRTAFPFMTFGLLSGALWDEEAWGSELNNSPEKRKTVRNFNSRFFCFFSSFSLLVIRSRRRSRQPQKSEGRCLGMGVWRDAGT